MKLIAGWEPEDESQVWGTDTDPVILSELAWARLELAVKYRMRHVHIFETRQCVKSRSFVCGVGGLLPTCAAVLIR